MEQPSAFFTGKWVMSPWSIPYLHESKPPTILHSQRWRFWFPIESRALTQKDLTKATEILRDRTNYIDSTCTHIYTYIYTYVYRWVLYSSFIVQHSKSQLKHIILFKFHMYVFSKKNRWFLEFPPPKQPAIHTLEAWGLKTAALEDPLGKTCYGYIHPHLWLLIWM